MFPPPTVNEPRTTKHQQKWLNEDLQSFEPFLIVDKENDSALSQNKAKSRSVSRGDTKRGGGTTPLQPLRVTTIKERRRDVSPTMSDEIPLPSPLMASAEAESLHPLAQSQAIPVPVSDYDEGDDRDGETDSSVREQQLQGRYPEDFQLGRRGVGEHQSQRDQKHCEDGVDTARSRALTKKERYL